METRSRQSGMILPLNLIQVWAQRWPSNLLPYMDLHTWQFRKHVFLRRLGLGYATLGFKLAKIIKIENRVARKSRKGIMAKENNGILHRVKKRGIDNYMVNIESRVTKLRTELQGRVWMASWLKKITAHYIGVKSGVLTIMIKWHGQYWIPSDKIENRVRRASWLKKTMSMTKQNLSKSKRFFTCDNSMTYWSIRKEGYQIFHYKTPSVDSYFHERALV